MPTIDSSLSSLSSIRTKIRRLTRSPSSSQITDAQIDEYVNTFVIYDFLEFTMDKQLTFFLMPNIDIYETNVINPDDPLYNFKNKYLSIRKPIYVGGEEVAFFESREQFYGRYPMYNYSTSIGTGTGATTVYSGTLINLPILANNVMFSSVDSDNNGIVIKDIPIIDASSGYPTMEGDLIVPNTAGAIGRINYITGVYSFTFPAAPGLGADIIAQTYSYKPSRPKSVLYENNQFIFRPIPDKSYRVDVDVYQRPSELLGSTSMPELSQWWQYIAYGAAKKLFEDRMDIESINAIMPEFLRQRSLVLQRLVIQQSEERTPTIYTDAKTSPGYGSDTF